MILKVLILKIYELYVKGSLQAACKITLRVTYTETVPVYLIVNNCN